MSHNPSEHQCTGKSIKLNPRRLVRITLILLAVVAVSCSGKETSQTTPNDALEDCREFYYELKAIREVTPKKMTETIREWQAMSDSASIAFARDTTMLAVDSPLALEFIALGDSVRNEMTRLVDSRVWTLREYAMMMVELSPEPSVVYKIYAERLNEFYAGLEDVALYRGNTAKVVAHYDKVLNDALNGGLERYDDLYLFLAAEDRAYRSFLEHLNESVDESVDESVKTIRDNTAAVVGRIVDMIKGDEPILDPVEALTVLTIRSTRRLTQNAEQCVEDIRAGKVTTDEQHSAYLWMLMQPWITFDRFAYSLMTEHQRESIVLLAKETQKVLPRVRADEFPIDLKELPALLIQTAIIDRL